MTTMRRSRRRDRILEILRETMSHPTAEWANTLTHHHLVCERCGSVSDPEVPVDESLTRRLGEIAGGRADRHEIRLYGTCAACARKGRKG